MNTIYDIQKYLANFGTIIYTGNRLADLKMLELELKELYEANLIDLFTLQTALQTLRYEIQVQYEKKP